MAVDNRTSVPPTMADAEFQRQQEAYRQAKTKSRAAEAVHNAAQSNHIQRLAEREAAHRTEDSLRAQIKLHGHCINLEKGLRDAEFGLKTASGRVEATAKVAAQADVDQKQANMATVAARQRMEDAKLAADRSRRLVNSKARSNGTGKAADGRQAARENREDEASRRLEADRKKREEEASSRTHAERKKLEEEALWLEENRKKREEEAARQLEKERQDREWTRALMVERRRRHETEQRQQATNSASAREQHQKRQRDQATENAEERERVRENTRKEQRRTYERRHAEWQRNNPRSNLGPSVPSARPQFAHTLWKLNVERAFADHAAINVFPEPPVTGKCTKPACLAAKTQRALKACACDVEAAFTLLNLPLKEARLAWHPDRFSKCSPEHREAFQMKAKEVFQVVMSMYSKTKDFA